MNTLTTGIVQSYSRATGIATVRTTAGTQEVSADVFVSPRFPRQGEAVKCTVVDGKVTGFRPLTDEESQLAWERITDCLCADWSNEPGYAEWEAEQPADDQADIAKWAAEVREKVAGSHGEVEP